MKKTIKLVSLFILVLISFIYTDKIFTMANNKDPVMKKIVKYKETNDILPVNAIIEDDTMTVGISGKIIDKKRSFKNMNGDFNEENIIYIDKLPEISITNNYDYYISKKNTIKKEVSIIIKIKSNDNVDVLTNYLANNKVKLSVFIDGLWLENNMNKAFDIINSSSTIYNGGYNGKYDKNMIKVTNKLIKTITDNKNNFCLNESKNIDYKKICSSNKLPSIYPTLINPGLTEVKSKLDKGIIIMYDSDSINIKQLKSIVDFIKEKGYKIELLEDLLKE